MRLRLFVSLADARLNFKSPKRKEGRKETRRPTHRRGRRLQFPDTDRRGFCAPPPLRCEVHASICFSREAHGLQSATATAALVRANALLCLLAFLLCALMEFTTCPVYLFDACLANLATRELSAALELIYLAHVCVSLFIFSSLTGAGRVWTGKTVSFFLFFVSV